jgi:anti-anti-sigma factor
MQGEQSSARFTYPVQLSSGESPQFEVEYSVAGATATFALAGELDLASVGALDAACDEGRLDGSSGDVVVDLSRLAFVDSTGTRGILRLSERCTRGGLELKVVAGPPAVQKALELTGIAERLQFVQEGQTGD